MQHHNRTARIAGVLFALTFVSAIAGAALYSPLLSDPVQFLSSGDVTRIAMGAACELVLIITNIGTAIVLFPILRQHHEAAALGFVAARIIECVFIAVGILSVLTVSSLRQTASGAGSGSDAGSGSGVGQFEPIAQTLVALHDWTFLLGPGFVVGIGNGLLLGFLMYRSRLVPRPLALFGLIGGPLMSLSGIAVLFGAYDQVSLWSGLATMPEIIWEASLGIYLIVFGFRAKRSAVPTAEAPASAVA